MKRNGLALCGSGLIWIELALRARLAHHHVPPRLGCPFMGGVDLNHHFDSVWLSTGWSSTHSTHPPPCHVMSDMSTRWARRADQGWTITSSFIQSLIHSINPSSLHCIPLIHQRFRIRIAVYAPPVCCDYDLLNPSPSHSWDSFSQRRQSLRSMRVIRHSGRRHEWLISISSSDSQRRIDWLYSVLDQLSTA
jgi:hypothetical protein